MSKNNNKNDSVVSRREFLETTGTMAVGGLLANVCSKIVLPEVSNQQNSVGKKRIHSIGSEKLVVLAGVGSNKSEERIVQAVKDAALRATDFSWLSQGDSVLIKPVLNSGNPFPATTSPIAIKAMTELLKDKGAKKVVLSDMSGIEHVKLTPEGLTGSSRELMYTNGMAQAALEAGAELHFPEEAGWDAFFEDYPINDSNWDKGIMMPNILQDVDHVVLIPRCGRHLLLGSSLGLKSTVGYWRTDSRLEYHKNASTIQEKTADANTVKCLSEKQRLVLTDATQIMTMNGPDTGFIAKPEVGLVIASESVVAHDMVSLAWLLHNRFEMSDEDIANSRDPYTKQFIVNNANRFLVVPKLGDFLDSFHTEKLERNDLLSIWDDRILNRSYDVFGGIPNVTLVNTEGSLPSNLHKTLVGMVSTTS
jgi:uncharacterized protein (DUF362 family)